MSPSHRSGSLNHRRRARNADGELMRTAQAAAQVLLGSSRLRPTLAFILGSGFGPALDEIEVDARVPYTNLPGFAATGVGGHAGEALVGRLDEIPVMVFKGRLHYYEGHSMAQITLPVRSLAAYGITDLLLTNAAGAIHPQFKPGELMVLNDHINFMGVNPLRGVGLRGLPRFVDLTRTYDANLTRALLKAGRDTRIRLRQGVYLAVSGPCYETPAEILAFKRLGADAVGMSTVPEAIVARQCGLRVAGLSCLTNLAAQRDQAPLSHLEVLEIARRVLPSLRRLLLSFTRFYSPAQVRASSTPSPEKTKEQKGGRGGTPPYEGKKRIEERTNDL